MNDALSIESKDLELRYGPAIAQFLCDELEITQKIDEDIQNRKLIDGYGKNTIYLHQAAAA